MYWAVAPCDAPPSWSPSRHGLAPAIVDDRDAMHTPILGQIVGHGVVLRHPVVPDRDRSWVPAEADLKVGLVDVVKQGRQEALTVTAGHAQDVRGKMSINIEKRFPRHRVMRDEQMHRRSHGCHALLETLDPALGVELAPG